MVKYALIVASLLDLICTRVCRLSRRYSFDERGYVVLGPSPHVRLLAACRRYLLLDVCACDGSHIVSLYPFFCALSARLWRRRRTFTWERVFPSCYYSLQFQPSS